MCAICAKFPSVSVTWCSRRNLLQPSNSHLPPALTKRIKRESGGIFRTATTGEAAGCLLGGFFICLVWLVEQLRSILQNGAHNSRDIELLVDHDWLVGGIARLGF